MAQVRVPVDEVEEVCALLLTGSAWSAVAARYPAQGAGEG
jgi:hypothetical protein